MTDNIFPLQAEKGEWILTPEGSLVQTNAKKSHKDMNDELVTDYQQAGSYIFSNDKQMVIDKKFAKEIEYGLEYHKYEEGKSKDIPKPLTFDKFLNKDKNTIAEIVGNIAKTYRVMDQTEHLHNPFIRRANEFNKVTRQTPIQIAVGLNELLRPEDAVTATQQMQQQQMGDESMNQQPMMDETNMQQDMQPMQGANTMTLEQFKYGGKFVPKAAWGDYLSGAASGAAAGSMIAPGVGTIIGAIIGGVGSGIISSEADKKKREEQAKIDALTADIRKRNSLANTVGNMSTFAKVALPVPKYSKTDYTGIVETAGNEYDRIIKSVQARRTGDTNAILGANNSYVRAMSNSGATATQIANAANNGDFIRNINENSKYYDQYEDNMRLNKLQYINPFIKGEQDENNRKYDINQDQVYNKYMSGINEFNSNYQNYKNEENNLDLSKYSMDRALDVSSSKERQDSLGKFSNTLTSVGSGYQSFKNMGILQKQADAALLDARTKAGLNPDGTNPNNPARSITDGNYPMPGSSKPIAIPILTPPNIQAPPIGQKPGLAPPPSNAGVIPTGKTHPGTGLPIFRDHLGRSFIQYPGSNTRTYI